MLRSTSTTAMTGSGSAVAKTGRSPLRSTAIKVVPCIEREREPSISIFVSGYVEGMMNVEEAVMDSPGSRVNPPMRYRLRPSDLPRFTFSLPNCFCITLELSFTFGRIPFTRLSPRLVTVNTTLPCSPGANDHLGEPVTSNG